MNHQVMQLVLMRFWQHFCIGAFLVYIVFVTVVSVGGFLERAGPVGATVCMLLMILMPFLAGPAAAAALIVDIRARWTDPAIRSQWLWLCLLLWPVGLYYHFAHGFRKLPDRQMPPPLPPVVSNPGFVADVSPPLLPVAPKSRSAGHSLIWGVISMVSPLFPLALPASFAGIIYATPAVEVR